MTEKPSDMTVLLEFVTIAKQEDGLNAHAADLYTVGASLVGLISSIQERNRNSMTSEHIAICMGLIDLVQWVTKKIEEARQGEQ